MKSIKIIIAIFLLIYNTLLWAQTKIFVSPRGQDNASGTVNAPFKSIQKAVNTAQQKGGNVEIVLTSGKYEIEKSIEISAGQWSQLTISGQDKQGVFLSGGKNISVSATQKVTDPLVRTRLQIQVVDSIRVIDFKKLGIPISNLHAVGFGRPSLPAWNELFVNDQPLRLSRWPNDSMALIGKIKVAGNKEDKTNGKLPVFYYHENRPKYWTKAENIWIGGYFGHGYADDMIPIAAIDTALKTISTTMFTTYHFMTGTDYRRWHAINLIEEIDRPGEYAIDYKNQKIYFYPPIPILKSVHLSVLQQPVFSITQCANVRLKNITIENTRGMGVYMQNTENVVIDACTFRNIGNVAVSIGLGTIAKEMDLQTHAMATGGNAAPGIVGDVAGRLYADPTFDRQAGKGNGVKNSCIYNVGAGGVSLGGGNRITLTSSKNFVENCRIQRYNRIEKSYRPAVWIDGVGNRVSNCDISDAPSMAILFHGNNHIVEYCKITNVCTEVDDQGAVYYGRDPSEQGNIIRYNYFKDLSSRHRVTATYHDDGACGSEVYGNVYHRAGSIPVLIGGGQDNHYYNNIFMESPIAFHIDNRLQNWAANMVARGGVFEQRLKAVDYQQPPYSTAYPHLPQYFKGNPAFPQRNKIERNLVYKIKNLINGQTQWGEFSNNWIANDNPGFVDEGDPLKGLKPNAALYEQIKGFEPIPFEKMGCTLPQ